MPRIWIQVVGKRKPIQVPYEDGDYVDDLIRVAKAEMPNSLSADRDCIIASKDQGGQDELDVTLLVSDLKKDNSAQNPIWLTVEDDTGSTGIFLNCRILSRPKICGGNGRKSWTALVAKVCGCGWWMCPLPRGKLKHNFISVFSKSHISNTSGEL